MIGAIFLTPTICLHLFIALVGVKTLKSGKNFITLCYGQTSTFYLKMPLDVDRLSDPKTKRPHAMNAGSFDVSGFAFTCL